MATKNTGPTEPNEEGQSALDQLKAAFGQEEAAGGGVVSGDQSVPTEPNPGPVQDRTSTTDFPRNVATETPVVETTQPEFVERAERRAANQSADAREAQSGVTAPDDVNEEGQRRVEASLRDREPASAMQPEDLGNQSQAERNDSGLGQRRDGTGFFNVRGEWTQKRVASAADFVPEDEIPDEIKNRDVTSDIRRAEDREDVVTADFTFKEPVAAGVRTDQTNPVADANAEPFLTSYVIYLGRHDGQGQAIFPLRVAGTVDDVQRLVNGIEGTGIYYVPDWRRD